MTAMLLTVLFLITAIVVAIMLVDGFMRGRRDWQRLRGNARDYRRQVTVARIDSSADVALAPSYDERRIAPAASRSAPRRTVRRAPLTRRPVAA